jgi:hypothetical protein
MQGSYIDIIIAATRGRSKQESNLKSESMKLLRTQAGTLRILDTGSRKPPLMIA